jgi:peptide/nickel transport system substrate-binding protein
MSSDDMVGGWCPLLLCGRAYDPQSQTFVPDFELDRCCFMRTLMSYTGGSPADEGTIPRPDVARAPPTVSTDGLTWTFRLRPGLHYAPPFDDTEIVAADFIRSLERTFTPARHNIPPWAEGGTIGGYWTDVYLANVITGVADFTAGRAEHVSGLEAPDPHTLVVHLAKPTGDLASRLALPELGPIPANPARPGDPMGVAQGHDFDYGDVMVSSGPYMFEGSERLAYRAPPEDQLPPEGDGPAMATLVRNPSWSPDVDPIRHAWADRIELYPVASPRSGEMLVRSGALDVILNWSADAGTLTRWLDDPAFRRRVSVTPADGEDYMALNLAVPPLDDIHVRRAISLAVNREAVATAFEGNGAQQRRLLLTHLALDSYEDNLLLSYQPPGFVPTGNTKGAREELALSRYDTDHDGRCDADVCSGLPLAVDRSDAPAVAAAREIASDLGAIGLGVDVAPLSPERFNDSYGDPELHQALRMTGWFKDYPSASTFFPILLDSDGIGGTNLSMLGASREQLRRYGYTVDSVPSVDDRIAACFGLVLGAQTRCWAELDQFLTEQVVPWIPLSQIESGWPASARVQDLNVDASVSIPMPALDNIRIRGTAAEPPPVRQAPAEIPAIPNGAYRVTVTTDDIVAAGGPKDDSEDAGTFTIELDDGWFRWRQRATTPIDNPVAVGVYGGSGNEVTFRAMEPYFNALDFSPFTWRLQGSSIVLSLERCTGPAATDPILCSLERALIAHPWERLDLAAEN